MEPVLILVILMQVATGLSMTSRRRRLDATATSGLYLSAFLLIHGSAAIYTRRITGLDTDYFWAAGSLSFGLLGVGFALYYGLAVISVFVHLNAAIARGWPGKRRPSRPSPKMAVLCGAVLATILLLPFSPWLRSEPLPQSVIEYNETLFGWMGLIPSSQNRP